MKTIISVISLLLCVIKVNAQTIVTMRGDTVNLQSLYSDINRVVVFVNSGSCTGCKDQLNNFLSKNDTNFCKVIIIREIGNTSSYLKRQMKADVDNYFTAYNALLFQLNSPDVRSPYIITVNKKNEIKRLSYDELYQGVFLTKKAQQALEEIVANK